MLPLDPRQQSYWIYLEWGSSINIHGKVGGSPPLQMCTTQLLTHPESQQIWLFFRAEAPQGMNTGILEDGDIASSQADAPRQGAHHPRQMLFLI